MTPAQHSLGLFCSSCIFFSPSPTAPGYMGRASPRGQCRRHAPVLDRADDGRLRSCWPMVAEDSYCGEHSILEEGDDAET